MTTVGLLSLLSPSSLLLGLVIVGWGSSGVWLQYLATFRRDVRASLLISCKGSISLLAMISLLGLLLVWQFQQGGMQAVFDVATSLMFLGAIILYFLWTTQANWRWYFQLRKATRYGLTSPPWRQLSVSDLFALMVMIGSVLGMMSFLFRNAGE